VVLKEGCRLKQVIVDKLNVIKGDEQIGFDVKRDRFHCHIDPSGIRVVPKAGMLIKNAKK
jgi:ADP-glucose pyrophosphorylase